MTTIHQAVQASPFATDIEIIDVPVLGIEPVVLVRSRRMPEFAFVVWADKVTDTQAQLRIKLVGGKCSREFSVLCGCCPNHVGIIVEDEQQAVAQFHAAVIQVSQTVGVSILFVRKAYKWTQQYGRSLGVNIVDTDNHPDAYHDLYGRIMIREALRCLEGPRRVTSNW